MGAVAKSAPLTRLLINPVIKGTHDIQLTARNITLTTLTGISLHLPSRFSFLTSLTFCILANSSPSDAETKIHWKLYFMEQKKKKKHGQLQSKRRNIKF